MIYDIVRGDVENLTQSCVDFDFNNPQVDPVELSYNLVETMYKFEGLGLAAIQVGIPLKVFCMRGLEENYVFFNPKIVASSIEREDLEEGCLSWPGFMFTLTRSKEVRVRFTGPNGGTFTKKFNGLTGRVIQHEMDHIESKLFFEGVSRLKLEKQIREAKNLGFDYSTQNLYRFCGEL